MIEDDPLLADLSALLKRAREEGYQRGYREALDRIVQAAGSAVAESGSVATTPTVTPEIAAEEGGGRKRLPRGLAQEVALQVLESAEHPLTIPEIEARATRAGEGIKQSSIRIALSRLEELGKVMRDGRRWFSATAIAANDANGAEPPEGGIDRGAEPHEGGIDRGNDDPVTETIERRDELDRAAGDPGEAEIEPVGDYGANVRQDGEKFEDDLLQRARSSS